MAIVNSFISCKTISFPHISSVKYINELYSFKFSVNSHVIGASASLVAFGIQSSNKDIDLFLDDATFKQLQEEDRIGISTDPKSGIDSYIIKGTHIDLGFVNEKIISFEKILEFGTEVMAEFRFLSLPGCLSFYKHLSENAPTEYHKNKWTATYEHLKLFF